MVGSYEEFTVELGHINAGELGTNAAAEELR